MNSFVNGINTPRYTTTTNGMAAFDRTGDKLVDLFFNIGAARNNPNITKEFAAAFGQDRLLATKLLFWARDVRGGAGERKVFRDCLKMLAQLAPEVVKKNIPLIPEFGRWDDLFVLTGDLRASAMRIYAKAIREGNGLAAKWADRKGINAIDLRNALKMTPKQYRKTIVGLTNVVEQAMCSKDWTSINFEHVPSVAAKMYQRAFDKNAHDRYQAYRAALVKGTAKVNASSIFPHDVLVGLNNGMVDVAKAQWEALPNYMGDQKVLALCDVSGSMGCSAGGSNVTCLDICVALGLYVSDKLSGPFKDTFMTFTTQPQLEVLRGDIVAKVRQLNRAAWHGSTNIEAAFDVILATAVRAKAPQSDMPNVLLIMSDMQFNACTGGWNMTMQDMMRKKYARHGYVPPTVVFWNINGAYGNKPGTAFDHGVMLVSGYSPAILKSVLAADLSDITPRKLMLDVLESERYAAIVA